jgi:hypothetical protein
MDIPGGGNANKGAVTGGGVLDTLTRARIETMSRPVRRIIAPIMPLRAAKGDDDIMSQEPGV